MELAWLKDRYREERPGPWRVTLLIWLLTGLTLLIGWAALEQQVQREQEQAGRAAVQQVRNRAIAFEQYAARTFEAADLVTQHIGEKYLLRGTADEVPDGAPPRYIDDPLARSPLFRAVHVVTLTGQLAASTVPNLPPIDLSDHPVSEGQRRTPGEALQITPPMPSRVLPGRYIHVTRRVLDERGRPVGFVAVQIHPVALSSFLREAAFRPSDLISVIGLDGITLARREGNRISAGEDLRGRLVMRRQQASPNGTYVGPSSIDGVVRYFSHRRLQDYPVFVTAGVSQQDVLHPVEERTRVYRLAMLVLTIAGLLLAALITLALNRRQRRQEELMEANQRLKSAQRLARVGDWHYDMRTGEVLWSDQLCEMYERDHRSDGLTFDEFLDYLDEDGKRIVRNGVDFAIRTGEPQAYELTVLLPSGGASHRFIKAVPIRNENGEVIALEGTDQDISTDRLLRELEGQVAHLARVDAMNTMASTLAHELNQPLTAASNYLSGGQRLLEGGAGDPSKVAEAVGEARRQVLLAGQIIRRVREMVGPGKHEASPVSLPDAIGRASALLAVSGAGARVPISVDIAADAHLVWADPVQVQQVLLNIIKNACEAASENRQPRVRVAARRQGDSVRVTVKDNGSGLGETADSIFSSFASTKKSGLGLGLSISRTIVEYHRGRIWVEKTGHQGTVIAFTLPAMRPDAADDSPLEVVAQS